MLTSAASDWSEITRGSYPLFDAFCVFGVPLSKEAEKKAGLPQTQVLPKVSVLYQYPKEEVGGQKLIPHDAEKFALPRGAVTGRVRRTASSSDLNKMLYSSEEVRKLSNSYVFILSGGGEAGSTIYGICVTNQELLAESTSMVGRLPNVAPIPLGATRQTTHRVYCFLTRHPCFRLHFDLLYALLSQERLQHMIASTTGEVPTSLELDADSASIVTILEAYRSFQVPSPGESISFPLTLPGMPPLGFDCPTGDSEAKLLAEWGGLVFSLLSLDHILAILSALLTEHSIVVVSDNLGLLSSFAMIIVAMLRPFSWQGMFIPILPDELEDFLHSPVPFISGVTTEPPPVLDDSHVHVYLSRDAIRVPKTVPTLPQATQLKEQLGAFHSKTFGSFEPSELEHLSASACAVDHGVLSGILSSLKLYYHSVLAIMQVEHFLELKSRDPELIAKMVREQVLVNAAPEDKPFLLAFLETQMFAVYCDAAKPAGGLL